MTSHVGDATQLTDVISHHGEGPVWHEPWGGLRFVDMLVGDVVTVAPDGQVDRQNFGAIAAAIRPTADDGIIIATGQGVSVVTSSGARTDSSPFWADLTIRMNDGACDPHGRFYCGSISERHAVGVGNLFQVDADLKIKVVVPAVTVSNGLDWSPDGTEAYYIDSRTQQIDVFDYTARAGMTNRRPLIRIPVDDGVPDGLCVDVEGHLWVALWGAGLVRRYSPGGRITAEIAVPASQVTSMVLGGRDLRDLYITTSRYGLESDRAGTAGAVFHSKTDVAGQPTRLFAC